MKVRRLHKQPAQLEITAFLNLIVVLVPFLLSTAVFSRLAVIELSLPPAAAPGTAPALKAEDLQLEVVIRADALEVGDRLGGLIQRIADVDGHHDLAALATLAQQLKARFPAKAEASVLAEPDTPYDTLVAVMDALRAAPGQPGVPASRAPLFPALVVGDAPQRAAAGPGARR
ncbi:MAG: biopolymer transporter ExbD [Burkholderiales bacterium]|nr:biopolymer transporter ExbD [Burkholderiales bacterium]